MSVFGWLGRKINSAGALGYLNWVPDSVYLRIIYRARIGKKLNLKNPQTFNEKLQWIKLYDRKPEYTTMVDKNEAKRYVAERISDEYIIPTLGVWEKFEDIDFDTLPNQFVLKCTHDSGGLVICRDKSKLDIQSAKAKIENSLKTNFFWSTREWPYKNVKPRIIAETYMEMEKTGADGLPEGLMDYKFYCFNGEPRFLYISKGLENHLTARVSFLTMDWKFAPYGREDYKPFDELPEKPEKFDEMVRLASVLSKGFSFLRVDLYQIQGRVFFSELTFSPCAGMMLFKTEAHDEEIGRMLVLPKRWKKPINTSRT